MRDARKPTLVVEWLGLLSHIHTATLWGGGCNDHNNGPSGRVDVIRCMGFPQAVLSVWVRSSKLNVRKMKDCVLIMLCPCS